MTNESGEERDAATREPVAADFLIPLIFCALAGYYFVSTTDLVWEAKATGIFVGGILVALCVAHMIRLVLLTTAGRGSLSFGGLFDDGTFNRQRLGLLVLVAAYIATIHWVGTATGLFLLLIAAMRLLGVRSLRALIGTALVTALTVYALLIHVLGSHLPQGPVERLLTSLLGGG